MKVREAKARMGMAASAHGFIDTFDSSRSIETLTVASPEGQLVAESGHVLVSFGIGPSRCSTNFTTWGADFSGSPPSRVELTTSIVAAP